MVRIYGIGFRIRLSCIYNYLWDSEKMEGRIDEID